MLNFTLGKNQYCKIGASIAPTNQGSLAAIVDLGDDKERKTIPLWREISCAGVELKEIHSV